jgi:phosphoglycerate dehydrogenase-like enzyme
VKLWIPDRVGHDAVGDLPDGVVVGLIPRDGELPGGILEAEFLVPSAGDRRVLGLLGQMPALRVIQTLSAGVDWLLPFVPPDVTVCDAAGARDVAVAEWVLAVILSAQKMLPEMRDDQREHRWEWRSWTPERYSDCCSRDAFKRRSTSPIPSRWLPSIPCGMRPAC